ncbi:hypothetical protein [Algicola sagamiensis]|uniref:hypothetical protein n=1 Tax=Algicola sagamiensis TaxID=163869 RepID=UPI000371583C|nr:hypothetical protein [Algicola sagamiensis]
MKSKHLLIPLIVLFSAQSQAALEFRVGIPHSPKPAKLTVKNEQLNAALKYDKTNQDYALVITLEDRAANELASFTDMYQSHLMTTLVDEQEINTATIRTTLGKKEIVPEADQEVMLLINGKAVYSNSTSTTQPYSFRLTGLKGKKALEALKSLSQE